jgi:hypothetical protein
MPATEATPRSHRTIGLPTPPSNLPVVRLRFELQAARRAGRSFNESWPTAMSAALSTVSDGREVRRWATALYQTREAWRLAWDRRRPVFQRVGSGQDRRHRLLVKSR